MATGTTVVTDALRAIGRITGPGRGGATSELAEGFRRLNQMLEEWSQGKWAIYDIARDTITLAGGVSYTIGPTGTANTTRPIRIVSAYTLSTGAVRRPCRIVTADEFSSLVGDDAETGNWIELLCPDYALPLCALRFWPVPGSGTLVLWSLKPLASVALIGDTITLPPGYEEAIVSNLGCRLASDYGKEPSAELKARAQATREAIASTNIHLTPINVPEAA